MKVLLVDLCFKKNSIFFDEFVMPVKRIVKGLGHDAVIINRRDKIPSEVEAVILCGTALKDNQFLKDTSFVKDILLLNIPVLGICAGAEAIASALGFNIIKAEEIGMTKIRYIKRDKEFEAYELHTFAVDAPKDIILASSDLCSQIIQFKDNIFGVMFHPEVRNEWLIREFLSL